MSEVPLYVNSGEDVRGVAAWLQGLLEIKNTHRPRVLR